MIDTYEAAALDDARRRAAKRDADMARYAATREPAEPTAEVMERFYATRAAYRAQCAEWNRAAVARIARTQRAA